jgi:Nucleosome assembly protein (NAP)
MKKKPKKGAKPGTKPLTKLEPVPSFFSFFSPPEVPAEGTELSEDAIEELQATMEEDYEMGWVPCWQSPNIPLLGMSLWHATPPNHTIAHARLRNNMSMRRGYMLS